LWRTAGIQSFLCFIVAYFVSGHQPQIGASADRGVASRRGDFRFLSAVLLINKV
jgi:hypothetical protein